MSALFYFSQHFHFQIDMRAFDIIYPLLLLTHIVASLGRPQHYERRSKQAGWGGVGELLLLYALNTHWRSVPYVLPILVLLFLSSSSVDEEEVEKEEPREKKRNNSKIETQKKKNPASSVLLLCLSYVHTSSPACPVHTLWPRVQWMCQVILIGWVTYMKDEWADGHVGKSGGKIANKKTDTHWRGGRRRRQLTTVGLVVDDKEEKWKKSSSFGSPFLPRSRKWDDDDRPLDPHKDE